MRTSLSRLGLVVALMLVAGACGGSSSSAPGSAKGATSTTGAVAPNTEDISSLTPMNQAPDAGAERLHFKVGPFTVEPGQNNIATRGARRSNRRSTAGSSASGRTSSTRTARRRVWM